jgi:hypothetical protein
LPFAILPFAIEHLPIMSPRLLFTLLSTAALLLAGCLPESKNPLSTPANSTIDTRLEGIYLPRGEKSGEGLSDWHFHYRGMKSPGGQSRTTPWLEILGIEHEKDGGLKQSAYRALTTHIGVHDYLSFFEIGAGGDKGKAPPYSFARYELNWAGDLRVWLANNDAFAQAIKAGKLHGTVKQQNLIEDVVLTDSTEHLAAFLAAGDPGTLFSGKPIVFYRVAK